MNRWFNIAKLRAFGVKLGEITGIIERQAAKQIQEAEIRYRTLFEQSPDGVTIVDPDTTAILEFNEAAHTQLGYSRYEFARMKITDIEASERDKETKEHVERIQRLGKDEFTTKHRTKQGEIRDVMVIAKPIVISGKTLHLSIHRDITRRMKAEQAVKEERDKAQKYLDIAEVMLVAIDTEQRVTLINRKGCEILGYPENEVIGKNWFDNFISERIRGEVKTVFNKLIAGEIGLDKYFVNSVLTKSGEEKIIAFSNTALYDEHGKIMGTLSSGEDITERQRWEEELKLSAQLLDSCTDSIFLHDLEGNFVFINEAAYKSLGYTREELMSINLLHVDTPEHAKLYASRMQELLEKGSLTFETVHFHKNGSLVSSEVNDRVIESGGRQLILGVVRDITERKKFEDALRDSEKKFRDLFEQSRDAAYINSREGKVLDCNHAMLDLLGYTREELQATNAAKLYAYHTDRKKFQQEIEKKGFIKDYEVKLRKKDRTELDCLITGNTWQADDGSILGYRGIIRDITERKRAEQALSESEERYRLLVDLSPDAILVLSEDKITFINSTGVKLFGADSPEQLVGKPIISLVHPDYRQIVAERARKSKEEGTVIPPLEEKYLRLDGTTINVEVKAAPFVYQGKTSFQVIVRDITERKKIEEELKLNSQLLNNAADPIYIRDSEGNFVYVNETACKFLGYSKEELLKMKLLQIIAPEYVERAKVQSQMITAGDTIFESAHLRKDGSIVPVEVHGQIIEYKGKKLRMTTSRDITERKRAEEALDNEAIRRRILIEQSKDGIVVLDQNGKVYEANQRFAEMLGYSPEEISDLHVWDWEFQYSREQVQEMLRSVDETGDHFETRHRRKDGTTYYVDISTNGSVFAGQKLIFCVCRDVTDRKHAEEELRLRAQLLDNATDAIHLHDFDGNLIYVNETMCRFHGYSKEELMNMKLPDLLIPEHARSLGQRYQTLIEKGYDTFESVHLRKDGSIIPLEIHSRLIKLENRMFILSVARDITERQRAEEELKLRAYLLDNATDFIFLRDFDENFVYVNETALKTLGYSREEFMKLKVRQTIAPGYPMLEGQLLKELMAKGKVTFESADICKDGSIIPLEVHSRLIKSGSKRLILSAVRDITERRKFEDTIRQLAYHDPLTGLPNRTLLNDRITLALAHAARYDSRLALMITDLDRFKEINDKLGHNAGDELLKEVSNRLLGIVRRTDTVSRMGGDEFVVLLPEVSREEDLVNIAQKILETIRKPFVINGHKLTITTSIGIAVYPEDGKNFDSLNKRADIAMYCVKEKGRNSYLRYTPNMAPKTLKR